MNDRIRQDLRRVVRELEAFVSERESGAPRLTFANSDEVQDYVDQTMREYRERYAHHVLALYEDLHEIGIVDEKLVDYAHYAVNPQMLRSIVLKLKVLEVRLNR